MRYAVVIEKADGNYSAYVPDLPGATGDSVAASSANPPGDSFSHRRI
jgi:predicted RNase H-like HicB family nuclease